MEILPPRSDLALEFGDAIDDGHVEPAAKDAMCRFAVESVNPCAPVMPVRRCWYGPTPRLRAL
jgi:hypothetical protein